MVRRPGLDDSIFMRFPLIGVDALKSNGEEARARLLLLLPLFNGAVANV